MWYRVSSRGTEDIDADTPFAANVAQCGSERVFTVSGEIVLRMQRADDTSRNGFGVAVGFQVRDAAPPTGSGVV